MRRASLHPIPAIIVGAVLMLLPWRAKADDTSSQNSDASDGANGSVRDSTADRESAPSTASEQYERREFAPFGVKIGAGGGATDFVSGPTQSMTSTGGYWDVRLTLGTRSPIAAEVAYLGSAGSIRGSTLNDRAVLLGNGLEGALRLQIPIQRGIYLIEPFGFGGIGWMHYSITNTVVQPGNINSSDNVLTVPVGGGLALGFQNFTLEGRFTYRPTFNEGLVTLADGSKASFNNWTAGALGAVEF